MSLIIVLASCQFIPGPEVGHFLNRNSVSLSSCTLWVPTGHPIRDSQMSTAISSFQAWASSRTSHSESLTASFTTRTSKQYDSRRRNPLVGADQLGSVRHVMSGVSFALLSWPDVSPSAIISCREVLSSVTWASSASFFGTPFPLSSFLGGSLEAILAIWQLRRLSELRGSCESGKNYHGARVATITALT